MDLVVAGGINIDNIVTPDGAVLVEQMGGNGVYAAVGARLWSDAVGLAGIVPRNYPRKWLDALRAHGVTLDGVATADEDVTSFEWFFYRPDGSRTDHLYAPRDAFTGIHGTSPLAPAAAAAFEAMLHERPYEGRHFGTFRRDHPLDPTRLPESYRNARAIHFAPGGLPDVRAQVAFFRAQGARITFDPGFAAATMGQQDLRALLAQVDAFLPSEKELRILVPDTPLELALARLAAMGPATVAVKIGARGALLWDRAASRAVAIPAFATTAVDPTGAGDAWCAGFAAGWLRSGDALRAACHGTVSASFAVEGFGALHALAASRAEAERRLHWVVARVDAVAPAAIAGGTK